MKWALIVLVLLALLVAGFLAYGSLISNPRVVDEISKNPSGARAQKVMLLTLPSNRQLPVNYLQDKDTVFVGADGPWWRELRDGATVRLFIRGEAFVGEARVVLNDPNYTHEVFERLRPTAPSWLPDWLNGKLVVISLSAP